MTVPVSTVPAAKTWLIGQLQTALTEDPTATMTVQYGPFAYADNNPDDMVWLGDADRQAEPWTLTGGLTIPLSMKETYDLTVNVSCYRGGDQSQTVEDRAWALIAEIETVVRTDPTFGGLLISSYPSQAVATVGWDEKFSGVLCSIPLTISCLAQL
jgi:hypothetical protein